MGRLGRRGIAVAAALLASVISANDAVQAALADPFGPVREVVEQSAAEDVLVVVGTADGRVFSHQKGNIAEDKVVRTASAAKMLAGATLMRLVEKGTLTLDDHPQTHLDFWTDDPSDPRSRVTLSHLLAFTSGFNVPPQARGCIRDRRSSIKACAEEFHDAGVGSDPGAAFYYGPAHLQIAGAMAEAATGLPFAVLFEREIAGPLGMTSTAFVSPSRRHPRLSGGAVSTAADYERLLKALLDGTLLSDLDAYTADRTVGVAFANVPAAAEDGPAEWHYAAGAWLECDGPFTLACAESPILSSPGAFGWTPWIDFANGYYAMVVMEERRVGRMRASSVSVELEQAIQPLIVDALRAR